MQGWDQYYGHGRINAYNALLSNINYEIGDVNQDNQINVSDIIIIVQFILGTEPTEEEFTLADWNEDGIINVVDIVQIVDYILNQ